MVLVRGWTELGWGEGRCGDWSHDFTVLATLLPPVHSRCGSGAHWAWGCLSPFFTGPQPPLYDSYCVVHCFCAVPRLLRSLCAVPQLQPSRLGSPSTILGGGRGGVSSGLAVRLLGVALWAVAGVVGCAFFSQGQVGVVHPFWLCVLLGVEHV